MAYLYATGVLLALALAFAVFVAFVWGWFSITFWAHERFALPAWAGAILFASPLAVVAVVLIANTTFAGA